MYTVKENYIDVVGTIWTGAKASYRYNLSKHDIDNIVEENKITKEALENWICSHTGDFSNILDFRALIDDAPSKPYFCDFHTETGEFEYLDTLSDFDEF